MKVEKSTADHSPKGTGGIVDAHMHVWSTNLDKYPLEDGVSADQLKPKDHSVEFAMRQGLPHEIRKAVLVAHGENQGFDSSYLTDMKRNYPGTYGVVAWIGEASENVSEQIRIRKKSGVDGFRIVGKATDTWPQSPAMNEMWDTAAKENMALCPLIRIASDKQFSMDALEHISLLCAKHPDTKIVIDHMAHVQLHNDKKAEEHLHSLSRNKNVYVKISRFRKFSNDPNERTHAPYSDFVPMIKRLIDSYGVERLMWASDRPSLYQERGNSLSASLAVVRDELGLSDNERDWILRKTAEDVFFAIS